MKTRKLNSVNFENETRLNFECPFIFALSLIGNRWKPAILWKISLGINRFGKLKKEIPNITEKMLSQHLKELEEDQLISKTVYPEVPPKVEYQLTQTGQSLQPVLEQLYHWGETNMDKYRTQVCQED